MKEYRKEVFEGAIEAINLHILSLGGNVEVNKPQFDPYKAALITNNPDKLPI